MLDDPLTQPGRTVPADVGTAPVSSGQKPFPASKDAFLSKPGHFFLKIHDSLEANMTIVQLSGVQRKSLRQSLDLECDQVIDFASQSKESLLSHRMCAAVLRVLLVREIHSCCDYESASLSKPSGTPAKPSGPRCGMGRLVVRRRRSNTSSFTASP